MLSRNYKHILVSKRLSDILKSRSGKLIDKVLKDTEFIEMALRSDIAIKAGLITRYTKEEFRQRFLSWSGGPSEAGIAAAHIKGNSVPTAVRAEYNPIKDSIRITLNTGFILEIDRKLLQRLQNATLEQLLAVQVSPGGGLVYWDVPAVGFSISGLLAGRYGTEDWMESLKSIKGVTNLRYDEELKWNG